METLDHVHYMTHIENVPSILMHGILSYNKAQAYPHRDISSKKVQRYRGALVPGTNRQVHDFVPLYFATLTPTQHAITFGSKRLRFDKSIEQRDLVFIEVDLIKLFRQNRNLLFTDGNAASDETKYYTNPNGITSLDWDVIRNDRCYSKEYKRKKAAEVLVPDKVEQSYFKRLVFLNNESVLALQAILQKKFPDNCQAFSKFKYEPDSTHYYFDIDSIM